MAAGEAYCTPLVMALIPGATYFIKIIQPPSGGNMKIKVEYDELAQTKALWGPFQFVRCGDGICNLEATW